MGKKDAANLTSLKFGKKIQKALLLDGQDFHLIEIEALFKRSLYFILDKADCIQEEEKLFHLYNHIMFSQGGLLLLAHTPPSRWDINLPDLKSRLNALPALKINTPDEDLLFHVIQKLFKDEQVTVESSTIHFLLKHIERSFDAAHFWVEALNRMALSEKRRITIPFVREALLKEGVAETHQ